MFVLGALCVLLPLVAALETCDQSKTAAFLAKKQLKGNLLHNFAGKQFWFVALGSDGSSNYRSTEVSFGSISNNALPATFTYHSSNGQTTSNTATYTVDGDHVLSSTNSLYFFQCSTNLIASYRCQDEGTTGATGSKYFIWAALNKSEATVVKELESCYAEIKAVDASATFVRRQHP